MADKVLCEKSDLVTIADSVREQTETYNVPELGTAITEGLTEQADLINQIQAALEGKAAGGGGGGGTVLDAQVALTYTNTVSGLIPWKVLVFKNSSTMDYENHVAIRYFSGPSGTIAFPLNSYAVTDSVIVIYLVKNAAFESATGSEGVDIISCNDRVLALYVKPEATADTLTCSASVVSA